MPIRHVGMGIAVSICIASAAVAQSSGQAQSIQLLQSAVAKAQSNDCKGALEIVAPLQSAGDFATLQESQKVLAFDIGVSCALGMNQLEVAYDYAVKGTGFPGATLNLLRVRMWFELGKRNPDTAATMVERMASDFPGALNDIPIHWFVGLNDLLKAPNSEKRRERLLAILSDAAYIPAEIGFTGDYFRRDYAAMLADAGKHHEVAAVIALITELPMLIRASVDPRFRSHIPSNFDARAAVEADLRRLRSLAIAHPESVNVILEISKRLRALGRADEALDLLEASRPDGPKARAYSDLDRKMNWWWDAMAQVYGALGRYEDAVSAFQNGMASGESGQANVSQTLNLGALHLHFGRSADALKTVEAFNADTGTVSPFGLMIYHLERGCARFLTGDRVGAQSDVDYALAHEQDHPGALTDLLLCTGDIKQAAAVMIRRLDSPDQRAEALLLLSDYDAPAHPVTTDPTDAGMAAIKSDPAVVSAIARAGGKRRFALQQYQF